MPRNLWSDARSLVGTWRRFGPFGPVYRIDRVVGVPNGEPVFVVAVIGPQDEETVERLLAEVRADPLP